MNQDLMVVLSMRRKEMAFQEIGSPDNAQPRNTSNALGQSSYSPLAISQSPPSDAAGLDYYGAAWHWIAHACHHFALQRQTAHFALQYVHALLRKWGGPQPPSQRRRDSALVYAASGATSVRSYDASVWVLPPEHQVRQVATVCVFMAAKIEEVHPPKAAEVTAYLANASDHANYATNWLITKELEFSQELKWQFHPPSPYGWLLFLLSGHAPGHAMLTMADFIDAERNPSGTKELLEHAVQVLDTAMLDAHAPDYLPSVLAGACLLLVDSSLDLNFVAQFLQLEPSVLWDCRRWLHHTTSTGGNAQVHWPGASYGYADHQHRQRWSKVAEEEHLFIQSVVAVPPHLMEQVLGQDQPAYARPMSLDYSSQAYMSGHDAWSPYYMRSFEPMMAPMPMMEPSPSYAESQETHDDWLWYGHPPSHHAQHVYDPEPVAPDVHVYHYKYGWNGKEGGDFASDPAFNPTHAPHFA